MSQNTSFLKQKFLDKTKQKEFFTSVNIRLSTLTSKEKPFYKLALSWNVLSAFSFPQEARKKEPFFFSVIFCGKNQKLFANIFLCCTFFFKGNLKPKKKNEHNWNK